MKQLLIATHNPAKISMYQGLLRKSGIKLLNLADLRITDEPEEDGQTFEENAIRKARFYFQKSQISTLAEDGGLEIDALNGEPGVKSRRWPGYKATDQKLLDFAIKKISGLPKEKRVCQLSCVIALTDRRGNIRTARGSIRGIMLDKPKGRFEKGFPFRSLFWSTEINKMLYDLTDEEKQKVDQRAIALRKLGLII